MREKSRLDQYVAAATRDNTRRSYQRAVEHFEVQWGGYLPATADSVARYLADYAETLTTNTLRQRLAALAQWHIDQGFPDPTKAPVVKKVLKGIQALHPYREKRAKPLQIDQLEHLIAWMDRLLITARQNNDMPAILKCTRDKALVLLGFWKGFRSDELCRLRVGQIEIVPAEGMILHLSQTKTDHANQGSTFKVPMLSRLCPVAAYQDWIALAMLTEGPVFRRINQWGHLGDKALHPNSLVPLLRNLFRAAQLPMPNSYSGHSLRRGFATWANANSWDVKMLMEYVGWKDMKSALRYIEGNDPFAQRRIEAGLADGAGVLLNPPSRLPPPTTVLNLRMLIEPFHKGVRGLKRARQAIETCCLHNLQMDILDVQDGRYRLTIDHVSTDELEETIDALLDEMRQIANNHQCYLEAILTDSVTGQTWS